MEMNGERWHHAQEYEQQYWHDREQQIHAGQTANLSWYQWRAERLSGWLQSLDSLTSVPNSTVLEIGNGPVGIISYFPARRRIGLDPLERFFRRQPELVSVRDQETHYLPARGEEIPLDADSCELIIVDNCIDHVLNPNAVTAEIRRVLKPGGLLYISVNGRSRLGYVVHRILSRLKVDSGHPHTFTKKNFLRLIQRSRFQLLDVAETSYLEACRDELKDDKFKGALKSLAGIADMPIQAVAQLSNNHDAGRVK